MSTPADAPIVNTYYEANLPHMKVALVDSTPTDAVEPTLKDLQKDLLHVKTQLATFQNRQANDSKCVDQIRAELQRVIDSMDIKLAKVNELISKESIRVLHFADNQFGLASANARKDVADLESEMQRVRHKLERSVEGAWDTAIGAIVVALFALVCVLRK